MNSVHSLDWNFLKTELNPNDRPVLSQKKRSGRRRHQDLATYEHRREECVFLQHVMEQQAQFREQIRQQQLEINQLKDHIEQLRALPGHIYDHLDCVASGFGSIQNHLGHIHQQRPGGGKRHEGL